MTLMRCHNFSRRKLLQFSAGLFLTGSITPRVGSVAASPAKSFEARNAMRFADMPDTSSVGLRPVRVVYASELWPRKKSRADPDVRHIGEAIRAKVQPQAPDLVVIDIEHWHLSGQPPQEIERNIGRYVTVAETFRRHLPDSKIGFYGMVPVREYWAPVNDDRASLRKWRESNIRLEPLAAAVDVIFPSLYAFYDRPEQWRTYAQSNIAEAYLYGKPVYPFLWPQYHGSRDTIAADFWRVQLETVYQAADGLVIWSPARGRPKWNPDAPWWLETVDFLKGLQKT